MTRLFAAAALAAFLAVALSFGAPVDGLWNSPDETANAFWAARVAAGEPLRVADAMVALGEGAVHPRSMAVADGALVPGSFPGIYLLYGAARIVFRLPLHLFAPILTAFAALAFAALVAKLFGRKAGVIAAGLFLAHPAVLYYGTRGLFHNMLFVDLAILAAACFALRPLARIFGARASADDALGGFILGWAIVTRASEAVWLVPAFAAFLPFAGKGRWKRLGAASLGALVPLLVFLRINAELYGSPWRTAYVAPAPAVQEAVLAAPAGEAVAAPASSALLPFGIHPRLVARNVWNYGMKLFWWQSLLAAAGFAWWCLRSRKAAAPEKAYALAALLGSAWLALLYGSWFVRDRLDPGTVTIGTSYVRYFLPAYVAAIPFAAYGLVRLAAAVRRPVAVPAAAILTIVLGVHAAAFAGDESLSAVRATLHGNAAKKASILAHVGPEAVLMTERSDKLVVPERLRIIPSSDAAAFAAAASASEFVPVYWYGLRPEGDEARRLAALGEPYGFTWLEIAGVPPNEALFLLDRAWDEGDGHDHEEGSHE